MAPKTPKGAKRSEKEPLEKDAAPKAAKEEADQTAGAAAATTPTEPKIGEEMKKSEAVVSEPVNTSTGTEEAKSAVPEGEPAATANQGGDALEGAGAKPESDNKTGANGTDSGTATAANVESGKSKEHEEPKADAEGKKVVEAGIGEAKPIAEAE